MDKITIKELKENINFYGDEEEVFGYILNFQENIEFEISELKKEIENAGNNDLEIADSLTDPYTVDLLNWYAEDVNRVYYMKEAIGELGADDGFKVLSGGQYLYFREVIYMVIEKIEKYLDTLE